MSYTTSFYRVPKETVHVLKNKYKVLNSDNYDEISDTLRKETVLFDSVKSIMKDDIFEKEKQFSKPIFEESDFPIEDQYFGIVSKLQFLSIIEKMRKDIADYFSERKIVGKSKTEKGEAFKNRSFKFALLANQAEWNVKSNYWRIRNEHNDGTVFMPNVNIDTNNKWLVSGSGRDEYQIFDLIHIYKIFDWDNDYLIVEGG